MKTVKTYSRSERRRRRISRQYFGTSDRPRIVIFRSNKYIYAQIVDDQKRITLATLFAAKNKESAKEMGTKLAGILEKKGIKKVVFDRGSYAYHGRVAAVAAGLREAKIIV